MTTSNVYTFNPTIADLVLEAFGRISIKPGMLTPEHMFSARMSANLELAVWANRGVNLWAVDLQTVTLAADAPTAVVDPATQSILDAYISITDDDGGTTDYPMTPIGRTEYDNIANKLESGRPTQYWFERIMVPQVTLYQVPDQAYTLKFHRLRRLQDAEIAGGQTPDIHYRFIDAFAAGMAARLAEKYAAAMWDSKKLAAKEAWLEARGEDNEKVDLHLVPDMSGYYA